MFSQGVDCLGAGTLGDGLSGRVTTAESANSKNWDFMFKMIMFGLNNAVTTELRKIELFA